MDNYTKFPNRIFDALLKYKLSTTQLLVMLYIVRNTNGWNKPQGDWISISRMAKDIRITRPRVSGAVNDLVKMGLVSITDEDRRVRAMRVTDPKEWDETVLPAERYTVPPTAHTKERERKSGLELKRSAPKEDEWVDAEKLLRGNGP